MFTRGRRYGRVVPSVTRRAEAMAATAVMQPAAVSFLSSSTGLLAMLDEEDNQLKAHALANINAVVPDFWAESEFCTGTAGARAHLARR
jgi:hypothetical protein